MGKIKTLTSGEVTIRKVTGVLTADELMNALREFYAGKPTKHVVWDLSAASAVQLTPEELRGVVAFVHEHAKSRIGGKTAVVAPNDVEYGIGRMLDAFAETEGVPFPFRTFRSLAEAAQWLQLTDFMVID